MYMYIHIYIYMYIHIYIHTCKHMYYMYNMYMYISIHSFLVAGRAVGGGRNTEYRLLMDQLVPASYLQLEDSVRNIALNLRFQGKPPVLTYKEFRSGLITVYIHVSNHHTVQYM